MKPIKTAPTYDEFKDAIEVRFTPMVNAIRKSEDEPTAREYMESEEGDSLIREHYELNLRRFNRGEVPRDAFLNDCASSAAICLSLIY